MLPVALSALAFPFLAMVVVGRLAVRRRHALGAPAVSEQRPRLSVGAVVSGALWPFLLYSMGALLWVSKQLIYAGVLPGPPSRTAAVAVAVGLAVFAVALGLHALYHITLWPGKLRGKDWAQIGIVLCWYVACFLFIFMWPRMATEDRVEGMCGENVARLARALQVYVEDHQGVFPQAEGWQDLLSPYLEVEGGLDHTPWNCRYAYNSALAGRRLADLPNPAHLVTLFEFGSLLTIHDPSWNLVGGSQDLPEEPCHRFGDNYGFADGSHRWLPRRRLGPEAGKTTLWARGAHADWVVWEP